MALADALFADAATGRGRVLFIAGEAGIGKTALAREYRPSERPERAGVDQRYAQEWLEHQAVARVLTVDGPAAPATERRYRLPEAHAIALLDEERPALVSVAELTTRMRQYCAPVTRRW